MADPNGPGGLSDPAARPPVNPVRQKARFRRMAVLLAWWALALIGLLLLTAGGPWWLILPVGVIGVLVVTNTIVIIRHTGPEESALTPGRGGASSRSWVPAPRATDPGSVAAPGRATMAR